jgi:hypothetical protein
MDDQDRLVHYIELWKQAIDVQKHFNDIELRVRSLALTILTFALGGATLAVKDGRVAIILGFRLQLGAIVLVAGLISWLAFYFMDQIWYHRLLVGAVKHTQDLEKVLRLNLPAAGLTHAISDNSPSRFKLGFGQYKLEYVIRSRGKIRTFYLVVAVLLIILAIIVQFGSSNPK